MSIKPNNAKDAHPQPAPAPRTSQKRGLRILPKSEGYFVHVTNRVVQQKFLFGTEEKETFTNLMHRWADFSGITILTHCLMNNHVHMMLWVPKAQQVRTQELLRRIRVVWPERKADRWERLHQASPSSKQKEMETELVARMHSLPDYMRVLKQSFSAWYNKKNDLYGVFWDGRYRSFVLKNTPEALFAVATYIDLNPMRAGICKDPKEYRWSGYGQASASCNVCRKGLIRLVLSAKGLPPPELRRQSPPTTWKPLDTWRGAESIYRCWLYSKGKSQSDNPAASPKRRMRPGYSSEEVLREFQLS